MIGYIARLLRGIVLLTIVIYALNYFVDKSSQAPVEILSMASDKPEVLVSDVSVDRLGWHWMYWAVRNAHILDASLKEDGSPDVGVCEQNVEQALSHLSDWHLYRFVDSVAGGCLELDGKASVHYSMRLRRCRDDIPGSYLIADSSQYSSAILDGTPWLASFTSFNC